MKNRPLESVCTARGFMPLEVWHITLAPFTGFPVASSTVPVKVAPFFLSLVWARTGRAMRIAVAAISRRISLDFMGFRLLFPCRQFRGIRRRNSPHFAICAAFHTCLAVQEPLGAIETRIVGIEVREASNRSNR